MTAGELFDELSKHYDQNATVVPAWVQTKYRNFADMGGAPCWAVRWGSHPAWGRFVVGFSNDSVQPLLVYMETDANTVLAGVGGKGAVAGVDPSLGGRAGPGYVPVMPSRRALGTRESQPCDDGDVEKKLKKQLDDNLRDVFG